MSDPALARVLAGAGFRRADSLRDERATEQRRRVEDFIRNLRGWLPPARETRRSVSALHDLISRHLSGLQELADDQVAARFNATTQSLTQERTRVAASAALPQLLACVAVASQRRLGLDPHPVQLAGARSLLAGELAEMRTGEGKTLVAAVAATVMAGSGAAVHVVSTNDYLAERDAREMNALFEFFGLSAGCVKGGMPDALRRAAYAKPICYASGKELVFDYLKDQLAGHGALPARVARLHGFVGVSGVAAPLIPALHFAIVDEADSVMVDEARTPMILSRDAPGVFDPALLGWAIDCARRMVQGRHFRLGAGRAVEVLPEALRQAPPLPEGLPASWQAPAWREHLIKQALSAVHVFHRDQQYIVDDKGKVQIVDESTGRVMPDRSWEHGLHQLIETKEGLALTHGRETLARMTFQRFFRRYYLLSGLTGTGAEAARELWSVYRLRVRRIPPNRPDRRKTLPSRCYGQSDQRWKAVAEAAIQAAARGQPVLIGTRSVEASELVAAELRACDAMHVVLNARQDAEEASIVAAAGVSGRITVATNMAGRGTDIKPDGAAIAAGGLHVLLTEFHDSPRVDRQLIGRTSRQGEPGSAQAIVCSADLLFERQPRWLRVAACGDGPVQRLAMRWLVVRAQRSAEQRARQARLQTLEADLELNKLIGFAGRVA